MGTISLYQINKSKKMIADIKMYLKKNKISNLEIVNLENNLLAYVGTGDVVCNIAVDYYNNVWISASNFGDKYIRKNFVVLYSHSSGYYTTIKRYEGTLKLSSEKFKLLLK